MTSSPKNLVSPMHISKLGHEIDEIRNRALKSICSKYQLQLVDENNVVNNEQLFEKLLDWFSFDKHPDEEKVVQLILRIAKSNSFDVVVQRLHADNVLKRINEIGGKVQGNLYKTISEVKDLVLQAKRHSTKHVQTKLVVEEPYLTTPEIRSENFVTSFETPKVNQVAKQSFSGFPWQNLTKGDDQLLLEKYEGLRYMDDLAAIMESCQFLRDVAFQDYPAEVFLQRPLLLKTLMELLSCKNHNITQHVLGVLLELSKNLAIRLKMLKDPAMRGTRWKCALTQEDSCSLIEGALVFKKFEITVPEYVRMNMDKIYTLIGVQATKEEKATLLSLLRNIQFIEKLTGNEPTNNRYLEEILFMNRSQSLTYLTVLTSQVQNSKKLDSFLRGEVQKCICDPVLVLFYPKVHELFVRCLTTCEDEESADLLQDYRETLEICRSMESARVFSLDKSDNFYDLLNEMLPSWEYHGQVPIMKKFVKYCLRNELEDEEKKRSAVLLKLLAYPDLKIRELMLKELNLVVGNCVAGKEDFPGDKLKFLFHEEVWKEVLMFGVASEHSEGQRLSRELITLFLNNQTAFSKETWTQFLKALQPSLPILSSYAAVHSNFARTVLRFFQPGLFNGLSENQILLANVRMLFCKEVEVNEEAFARLCCILVNEDPQCLKMPKVQSIKGLHLSSVCASVKPNQYQPSQRRFSTLTAMNDAISVLKNEVTQPDTRRTALDELALILEDSTLHQEFLLAEGLDLLVRIMENALTERDVHTYPTSVIPISNILKNLAMKDARTRGNLAKDSSIVLNIFRGLLLFTADDSFRQEAVHLLFILVFNDLILEAPALSTREYGISLPEALHRTIHMPIAARSHGKHSLNTIPSKRVKLMSNPLTARLLRVYWAALWLGDATSLLTLTEDNLDQETFMPELPPDMQLTQEDLENLQSKVLRHLMRMKLQDVQNAFYHEGVVDCILHLNGYLSWLEVYKNVPPASLRLSMSSDVDDLGSLPWSDTFSRYLSTTPTCQEDEALLCQIVELLRRLVLLVDSSNLVQWAEGLLTDPSGVFVELLDSFQVPAFGIKGIDLRHGIISLAQGVIEKVSPKGDSAPWVSLLRVAHRYLESNYADHLDCFLRLVAEITGAWTWDYTGHESLYRGLVTSVAQVVATFSQINDIQDSFIGSSIINSALLVLGHMLADVSSNNKGWEFEVWQSALTETIGLEHLEHTGNCWLITLTRFRDLITRAAAFTLLSELFASSKAFHLLADILDLGMGRIWAVGLDVVQDVGECALVRQKGALLLERLTALGSKTDCTDFLDFIQREGYYIRMAATISKLRRQELTSNADFSEQSTTPGLVTSLADWLFAIFKLKRTVVAQEITDSGVLVAMLGVLSNSGGDLEEEWLEMYSSVTRLVRCCVRSFKKARTLASSPEHVRSFSSLLLMRTPIIDPLTPQLQHVWLEAISLLSILLESAEGTISLKKTLTPATTPVFLETLLLSLSTPTLQDRSLFLINNMATPELSPLFAEIMEGTPTEHDQNKMAAQDRSLSLNKMAAPELFGQQTFGEVICEKMMDLELVKIAHPMASLFLVCGKSKMAALRSGFTEKVLLRVRKITADLMGRNVDEYRKAAVKKKLEPLLEETESLYKLLTNLCLNNASAKVCLAESGLADAVHRLWRWYAVRPSLLQTALMMLCTYTYRCERTCQTLALTQQSVQTPLGNRRGSLITSTIQIISTEMENMTLTKDDTLVNLCLQLCCNSCDALECRVALVKGNVLTSLVKLVPSRNKKRVCGDGVVRSWFFFMEVFTAYAEGQITVAEDANAMELIFFAAGESNPSLREQALKCLTHISFHPQNKCRLLSTPAPLLSLLLSILGSGKESDIKWAALVLWVLAANSHKYKMTIRTAGCENAVANARKFCEKEETLKIVDEVLVILRERTGRVSPSTSR